MNARQKKALYFQKLQNILEEYNKIFVVEIKHVTSKQVADIRKALRGQALLLFGKKTMIRRCMNKFVEDHPGHPIEKLIPLVILNALDGKALPVYGTGAQIRDWLYVEDHARALYLVATEGVPGETYNIGGHNEKKNIEVVRKICEILDELQPRPDGKSYAELITFVTDRPGHDLRYAIDAAKIGRELGWKPLETFESGIRKTVQWYLDHRFTWCKNVQEGTYNRERLGTGGAK